MAEKMPPKLVNQMAKAGLPQSGNIVFRPALAKNRRGNLIIQKAVVQFGPKKDKTGYVDTSGRIWIRDYGHAGLPDHWDVQEDGGRFYFRVDDAGNRI